MVVQCDEVPCAADRLKPCRSGQTGMRPFGSLGPKVEPARYVEQFEAKARSVRNSLRHAVPAAVLAEGEDFASPAAGHRHRAGPLAVHPSEDCFCGGRPTLEFTMWDPVARGHSVVRAGDVPIYSPPIAMAMEALRTMPIRLDDSLSAVSSAGIAPDGLATPSLSHLHEDSVGEDWGDVIGNRLRSVAFHSTLTGDLLVCFVYQDERLRTLRRGERLPSEDPDGKGGFEARWLSAARQLRCILAAAFKATGVAVASIDIVGRWKRRRLAADRDFVIERLDLSDGRSLLYKQPEGQFSNPNAPCEVHCLEWLCRQAALIRSVQAESAVPSGRVLRLLELHCGGGNNTVALAPYFDSVVAVEINRVLATAAEENLAANGITNAQLVRAPSATADGYWKAAEIDGPGMSSRAATVLVDPPRSGLDASTLALVAEFGHVLYISCNPEALAEDLRRLGSSHEAVSFAFFDMFPYTTHAECAVRLRRRSRREDGAAACGGSDGRGCAVAAAQSCVEAWRLTLLRSSTLWLLLPAVAAATAMIMTRSIRARA